MKETVNVTCPHCHHNFALNDGLLKNLKEDVSRELYAHITEGERELTEAKADLAQKQEAFEKQQIETKRKFEREVSSEIARREAVIRKEAVSFAAQKAAEENKVTLAALEQERDEQTEALKKARQEQLVLMADKRRLAEEKEALEIAKQRELDEEREKIRVAARKQADEENRRQLAEKQRTIEEMQTKLDEAQQKAAQGPIQRQGEVFEQNFEQTFRSTFPVDGFVPVPVGARGADLAHDVKSPTGRACGRILYENKQTKNWEDAWIPKLKGDMRSAKADIGVIVTRTLPKDVDSFGEKDGIWVSDPDSAIPLAFVLRSQLTEIALVKGHQSGAKEKMELLYDYLTGNEFRQRVQLVIEAFKNLRKELDMERNYMNTRWNKREKQINIVMENMSGMVGDVQGLAQGEILELPMDDEGDLLEVAC